MKIRLVSELFDLFDIPDIFFRERVESKFFTDIMNQFIQREEAVDDNQIFLLMHLSNRQYVYLNFYNILVSLMMKNSKYRKYRKNVVSGFLALLYTSWDFQWNNNKDNILSGKNRFLEFFNDNFYQHLSESEQFVKHWISEAISKDKVIFYLESIAGNNNNTNEIDEIDEHIVNILKDCMTLSPIYIYHCVNSEQDDEIKRTHIFNLLMVFFTQYKITNFETIMDKLNAYINVHNPVSEFTKMLIQEIGLDKQNIVFTENDLKIIREVHQTLIDDFSQNQFNLSNALEFNINTSNIF